MFEELDGEAGIFNIVSNIFIIASNKNKSFFP